MTRSLLIHVPKTGGTTLDNVLASGTPRHECARAIQFDSDIGEYARINDPAIRYVSGHFPYAMADAARFDRKFTLMRDPLRIIGSMLNFARIQGHDPRADILNLCDGAGKLPIFSTYLAPRFDTQRFLIERRYGLATSYARYVDPHSVEQVVSIVDSFDHVIEFDNLEKEICRIIIDDGLFPISRIPRLRGFSYEPDLQAAAAFLSDFDIEVYARCRQMFRRPAATIDESYEKYRVEYCVRNGLALEVNESIEWDLREPVGLGWHDAELSELGRYFRWSESLSPTIEIPLGAAGTYEVFVYVQPVRPTHIRLNAGLQMEQAQVCSFGDLVEAVTCIRWTASPGGPDWIQVDLALDEVDPGQSSRAPTQDERALGIVLGSVYVRRLA